MKKIFSACLAMMLLLACIPLHVSAEAAPVFAAGNAAAAPGDTIEIPVLMENNPGIVALAVNVTFDPDILTLTNAAANTDLFDETKVTFSGSYNTSTFRILWEDGAAAANMTESGTIATLTFLVNENAPTGDTAISVSYTASSVFDVNLTDVAFETRNGVVTIAPKEVGSWSFTEGSTLEIYEGSTGVKYITGLDITYPFISDSVETTGGWTFEVETNEYDMESTGAKLVIYDENGDTVDEFYTVLFGDVNGDGTMDGTDLTLLTYTIGYTNHEPWANFVVTDEFPQTFAADASHDYLLDGTDVTMLVYQIGNIEDIEQTVEM